MSAVLEAHEPNARYWIETHSALVREFDLLGSASDGTTRLRALILELAIRGKLAPQSSGDEPAEEVLARVSPLGTRTDKQGEPKVVNEARPALPAGWTYCRLDDLAWPQAGFAFKSAGFNEAGVGLPLIRIRDVGSTSQPSTFFAGEFREEFVVKPGEWLVGMDGEFRVRRWHAVNALLNQRVTRLVFSSQEISEEFVAIALQRQLTALQGSKAYTTVDHLSGKQIAEAMIALPPPAEQARIVTRVDELMRLCDALEAKGRLEAEQHARLLGTLLRTLTDSTTPEELAANWQRVAAHFDLLLDRPEAVDALEQTILQLAVRGVLCFPHVRDEPAAILAKRLQADFVDPETLPAIPPNWAWVRFNNLIDRRNPVAYGVLVPGPDVPAGVPLVRIADLSLTAPPVLPEKRIGFEVDAQYQRTRLLGGEILMGVVGSIGKLGVAPASWAGANIARAVCRIVPSAEVSRDFVLLLLQSKFMQSNFAGDTRTLAQPTLNVGLIRNAPTPLPPLAEQARIVTRVTELRRLCATLRQRLAGQQTVQSQLADALVEQALA